MATETLLPNVLTEARPPDEELFEAPTPEAAETTFYDKARSLGRKALAILTSVGTFAAGMAYPVEAYAGGGGGKPPETPPTAPAPPPTPTSTEVTVSTANTFLQAQGATASMKSVVDKKVIIGEDEHLSEANINPAQCHKFKTFKNSMELANGKIVFFIDHYGRLCWDSASPTHWLKEGGGRTGRNCGNEAAPIGEVVPMVPKGTRVINTTKLNLEITAEAKASAAAAANCVGSSAEAGGFAYAKEKVNLRNLLKSSVSNKQSFSVNLYNKAAAKASANCTSEVTTTSTSTTTSTTTPTPPSPQPQPQPPTIYFEQQPPAFEAPYENTTEEVYAIAAAPNNDAVNVQISTSDGNCASAGSVSPGPNPQEFGSQLAFGGDNCVGEDITVKASVLDLSTGESVKTSMDIGDIQPQPNPNG